MGKRVEDLRSIRLDKRLTQEEVAAKLKVSQSYYSAIERGKKPGDIPAAIGAVAGMRKRMDRTVGGGQKTGRKKA